MYEKRASPQRNVMKTDSRVVESGNTGDYVNLPHTKRSCDGKPYRVVAVGFALLCVIQAALNIGLRLYKQPIDENQGNLSVEADQYRRALNDIYYYSKQNWVYFNGSFYFISTSMKTWQESREDCLSRKADLVIINSRAEQEFLMKLKDRFWIGLSDIQREGTWVWVDGTPITISFWGDTEPNSFEETEEDCGEVRNFTLEKSWNDEPCNFTRNWICEKKSLFLEFPTDTKGI